MKAIFGKAEGQKMAKSLTFRTVSIITTAAIAKIIKNVLVFLFIDNTSNRILIKKLNELYINRFEHFLNRFISRFVHFSNWGQ